MTQYFKINNFLLDFRGKIWLQLKQIGVFSYLFQWVFNCTPLPAVPVDKTPGSHQITAERLPCKITFHRQDFNYYENVMAEGISNKP